MATPRKTATPPKAAVDAARESSATKSADVKDRKVHFLIRKDDEGRVTAIESFNGEMAARRGLDDHVGWQYLGLRPGDLFEVEAVSADV